jgi:hypothetical protein
VHGTPVRLQEKNTAAGTTKFLLNASRFIGAGALMLCHLGNRRAIGIGGDGVIPGEINS